MWLQLTEQNGDTIYVNMDNIVRFGTYTGEITGLTSIAEGRPGAFNIFVRETPEKIAEMLESDEADESTY
jgi:hypothetical protein